MTLESEMKVVETLEGKGEPDNLIRLSTGVVLRGKPANPTTLIAVLAAYPRPKPPEAYSAVMGRMMENPEDPDYKSRSKAWEVEQSNAILDAFILLGTELVSKPKGVLGHMPEKNNDFLEEYALLNLPMKPQSEKWRYLIWVKTIACREVADTKLIQEVVGRLSGVSKQDVRAAEEFPGR